MDKATTSKHPVSVKEKPRKTVQSKNPVVALAFDLMSSLPPKHRDKVYAVAWALFVSARRNARMGMVRQLREAERAARHVLRRLPADVKVTIRKGYIRIWRDLSKRRSNGPMHLAKNDPYDIPFAQRARSQAKRLATNEYWEVIRELDGVCAIVDIGTPTAKAIWDSHGYVHRLVVPVHWTLSTTVPEFGPTYCSMR